MRYKLQVLEGDDPAREFDLAEQQVLLGRDHQCDIAVPGQRVSRKHARLVRAVRKASPWADRSPHCHQIPAPLRDATEFLANNDAQARILHGAMTLVRARVLPQTWEAFCSVTLEGHDAREVAAKLHMTPHTVHEAVYRVHQLLKEYATLLAKLRDDPGSKQQCPAVPPFG